MLHYFITYNFINTSITKLKLSGPLDYYMESLKTHFKLNEK